MEAQPNLGTPGYKVLKLQRHGYDVTYISATDERVLVQSLANGLPPIAFVFTENLPYWDSETAQAVVGVAMSDTEVTLNDPALSTPQTISYNAFMLA